MANFDIGNIVLVVGKTSKNKGKLGFIYQYNGDNKLGVFLESKKKVSFTRKGVVKYSVEDAETETDDAMRASFEAVADLRSNYFSLRDSDGYLVNRFHESQPERAIQQAATGDQLAMVTLPSAEVEELRRKIDELTLRVQELSHETSDGFQSARRVYTNLESRVDQLHLHIGDRNPLDMSVVTGDNSDVS